jgi:cell fate (sporulation/competence/biofilm development) regulator YlbF (YheA/YmcA/DUF963 family)
MRKTPMMELRDKLLEEVQNLKEASETSEHLKGYREALKNVANDIDAQMLQREKTELIAFAYCQIQEMESELGDMIFKKVPEEIYVQTFGHVA